MAEQTRSIKDIRNKPLLICRNLLGLDLWPKQEDIIADFYAGSYRELVVCAGMRASKSFLAATIGAIETVRYLSLDDPWTYFKIFPGSEVFGFLTAVSEKQAKRTSFMFYRNIVKNSWWFDAINYEMLELSIKFPNGLSIIAIPSSSASQAGGTLLFVIMDELARFVDTEGNRGGDLVYETLSMGTRTLKGKVISISSPLYVRDKIMRLLEDAKISKDMLSFHLTTFEMNPNLHEADFRDYQRRNPEAYRRDILAIPSHAIEPFFLEPNKIQMDKTRKNPTLVGDMVKIKKIPKVRYYLHGDPAITNDAFGLAVAHINRTGKTVVDFLHRFLPPAGSEINARHVRRVIINIHRTLGLRGATFDVWNYPETIQALKDMRVPFETLVIKKEQYDTLKEQIYSGNISIPVHDLETRASRMASTVVEELQELELRNGQKVEHPYSGSKDVSDAVAGAVWSAVVNQRTRRNVFLRAGGERRMTRRIR